MQKKKKVVQINRVNRDYYIEVTRLNDSYNKKVISGNHYIPQVAEFMLASNKDFSKNITRLALEKDDDSFRNRN